MSDRQDTITIVVEFPTRASDTKAFVGALRELEGHLAQEPTYRGSKIYQDEADPSRVVLIETYAETRESFFGRTPKQPWFEAFNRQIEPLLAAERRVTWLVPATVPD